MPDPTREQLTFEAQSRGFEHVKQQMLDLSDAYKRFQQQGLAGLKPNEINLVGNALLGMGAAGAAGMALIARSSLQAAMYVERVEVAYSKLLGSRELAAGFVKELREFAVTTPFQLEQLMGLSQRLLAFGIARKEVIPLLRDIGDLVSAFGGTAEQLDNVVYALGHIQAGGRLTGREMRMLVYSNIPIFDILHQKLGLTKEDMQQIALQGIEAGVALKAIREYTQERYGGMMEQIMKTGAGAASNFSDALFELRNAIGQQLLPQFTSLIRTGTAATNWLANLSPGTIRAAMSLAAVGVGATALIGALLKLSAYQAIMSQAAAQRAAADIAANEAEAASADGLAAAYRRSSAAAGASQRTGAAAGWVAGLTTAATILYLGATLLLAWARKNTEAPEKPSRLKDALQTLGVTAGAGATGAAAGAIIGSVIPVVGTAVGAIVGGIVGLIGGIAGTQWWPGHAGKETPEQKQELKDQQEYLEWRSKLSAADRKKVDAIRAELTKENEARPESQRQSFREINAQVVQRYIQENSPQALREADKEAFEDNLKTHESYLKLLAAAFAGPEEVARAKGVLAQWQRAYAEWLKGQGDMAGAWEQEAAAAKTEREARLAVADQRVQDAQQNLALAESQGADADSLANLNRALEEALRARSGLHRGMKDNQSATNDLIAANKAQTEAARTLAQKQAESARMMAQLAEQYVITAQNQYADPGTIRQKRLQAARAQYDAAVQQATAEAVGLTPAVAAARLGIAKATAWNALVTAQHNADQEYMQAVLAGIQRQQALRREVIVGGYEGLAGGPWREAYAEIGAEMQRAQFAAAEAMKQWNAGNRQGAMELMQQAQAAQNRARSLQLGAGRERYQYAVDLAESQVELAKRQGAGSRLQEARQRLTENLWGLANYLYAVGDILGANQAAVRALDAAKGGREDMAARIIGGQIDERTRDALGRIGGAGLRAVGTLVREEGKNRIVIEFTGAEVAAGRVNETVQKSLGRLFDNLGAGSAAAGTY